MRTPKRESAVSPSKAPPRRTSPKRASSPARKASPRRASPKRASPSVSKRSSSPKRKSPKRGTPTKRSTPKRGTPTKRGTPAKRKTPKKTRESKSRMSTAERRNDRLMRVMKRVLKPSPEALLAFSEAVRRGELAKVVGTREAAGAPRKRTVFVMYTSRAVEDVRRENPDMKSNDVFREVARRWREEIKPNPKKYNMYKQLADEHNNRVINTQ